MSILIIAKPKDQAGNLFFLKMHSFFHTQT